MNTIKCGDCKKYWELKRAKRSKRGGHITLHKGHCLANTIYATNRTGNDVFPPGAKTAELPNGTHKIDIVRETDLKPYCLNAEAKR